MTKSTFSAKKYKKRDMLSALFFVGPLFIGLLIFYLIPMVQSVFYSFTEWGMFGGYNFTGLANYKKMLTDPEVFKALKNTLTYAVFTVPIAMAISIFIATLLNNKIKGVAMYRMIYFLPAVTMTSAVAMIWKWMFNSQYGIINQFLSIFGIKGPAWLSDSNTAMIALIIVGVWSSLGTSIVIYLAGLQGVPTTFYEAAEMDGAGPIRKFFKITLPLLTPTMFFNLITSLISALQVYDLIFLMYSQTNPALQDVQSLAYLFYKNAFILNDKGYGAAITVVLLILTLVITVINFSLQKKWVHYQ
ncbi:binding-protein-dependent transport system inner membrane protein [Listeria fleischmannii 1991]|uniref:sn-glycerol-3-phosphate transport system permease protein ugpA n=2 Tax=Listeria fleischmannii TaxID=1069827 RepID=A0A2X3GZW3_9LIST|nr:sugar ABC transporter permease [Listeria fleischmannii]EMG26835.1 ABC transporter permease [Listeria fleischmannii subsp. fleischmannii LU2006-1]KMT58330.1 binding-protein-dependent transport system inner membrane protein [Listeria fleischmannii 1991]SQC66203.1 sn-glycerol-3-phosphate transport system permease protein ugpA [Listeria fleischmannii subsp. fleischmannii]